MNQKIFICINSDCEGKIEKLRSIQIGVKRITKFCAAQQELTIDVDSLGGCEPLCPHCESLLKQIGQPANFFGTFQSMSTADKKKMLQKRSINHMKTGEMKDRTSEINHSITKM